MKNFTKMNPKGFTLIEVIVVIIIVAILGTLLVSYMSGGISRSALPVVWVKQEFNIVDTMENITADYSSAVSSTFDQSELSSFESDIASYETDGMTVTSDYINIARVGGTLTSETSANGLILRVKLQKGDQSVTGLFTR